MPRLLAVPAGSAVADDPDPPCAAAGEPVSTAPLATRSTLTADWGGLRRRLCEAGITLAVDYTADLLGAVRGGARRLAVHGGRLDMALDADLAAIGWRGAKLHVSGFHVHGRGLSADAIGNILTVSNNEALPGGRLFTLWVEQALAGEALSLRVGQLAVDDEFAVIDTAALFINSAFGWPALPATNLANGGPSYPFAAPGLRLKAKPLEDLTLLAAVFAGDPDPSGRNRSGTAFSFRGGVFVFGEAAYALPEGLRPFGAPGTVKAGFWLHTGRYDDRRFDADGLSLADPASSGTPRRRRGNAGGYLIWDQTILPAPAKGGRQLDGFLRLAANPGGRNLLAWSIDAGLVLTQPFGPGGPSDRLGLGFTFARIGSGARGLDRDGLAFATATGATATGPVRDYEAVLELSYAADLTPWWTVQPDLQIVFRPGGRIADPRRGDGAALRNAVVAGLRSKLRF